MALPAVLPPEFPPLTPLERSVGDRITERFPALELATIVHILKNAKTPGGAMRVAKATAGGDDHAGKVETVATKPRVMPPAMPTLAEILWASLGQGRMTE